MTDLVSGGDAEELARQSLTWLLHSAVRVGDGLGWSGATKDNEVDPTLYSGGAGVVVALLEGSQFFDEPHYAQAALAGARVLEEFADSWDHHGLYFGRTGIAFALHAVGDILDEPEYVVASRRVLDGVREAFDGERWSVQIELLGGNAGIALGALAMDDVDLAVLAVEPYVRLAEPTAGGVTWEGKAGLAPRYHHISHGTLGIVSALAAVAAATGRDDLLDLALAGAGDVVSRNEAGQSGFLVPHSDPQHRPELVERFSYGWCHGPAGDAQTFRLLRDITKDAVWTDLIERCWATVIQSGLPQRIRPGFWDNNGRCCGTAGVLALASDLTVESNAVAAPPIEHFADVLVQDLSHRATNDSRGARWSNHEHRADPGDLQPRHGWAMGNAGIVRELLRYARLRQRNGCGYAVQWPDQPAVDVTSCRDAAPFG